MEKYYKKWFFMLSIPAVLFFTFIILVPFGTGIVYSLTAWRGTYFAGGKPFLQSFVGIDNFIKAFKTKKFVDSLVYTFFVTLVTVPSTTVTALILALLVNSIKKGKGIFRTVFYFPDMLGRLAMGFIWVFIYQVVFTDILFGPKSFLHIEFLRYMTQGKVKALFAIVIMSVWTKMGYMMLIFVGGLNTIPRELYEAASIDGVSSWQRFRSITLPLLMPSITVVLFLTLANCSSFSDRNVALTEGDFGQG